MKSKNAFLFLIACALATLVVVVVGWFTGIRDVAYGALLSCAIVAFLPFVIVAIGLFVAIVLPVVLAILAALTAAFGGAAAFGGEVGVVELGIGITAGGVGFTAPYYRWLASRRHPMFWGSLCGLLLGGLLLWALISLVIVPGDARTVEILANAHQHISEHYEKHKSFPMPVNGHLPRSVFGGNDNSPVVDGFGHPLEYEVSGKWIVASWRLRSNGFDQVPGRDDHCISGDTDLMKKVEGLKWFNLKIVRQGANQEVKLGLQDKLKGVRSLRCGDGKKR